MPLGWPTPVVRLSWFSALAKPAVPEWRDALVQCFSNFFVPPPPLKPIKKIQHPYPTSDYQIISLNIMKIKKYLQKKNLFCLIVSLCSYCILISGGPLSALTCCVNVRHLSGDKKNMGWVESTKRCAFKQTGCALGRMWTWARNFETPFLKNISIESEMPKKKRKTIEDVCVSMDDLHDILSVQHCA